MPLGKREQNSTRAVFFLPGFLIAAWAPLIPLVQERLDLSEGQLGALLLCLGLGSITTMSVSGGLAAKFGCRKVVLAALTLVFFSYPLLAVSGSIPLTAILLMGLGAGIGITDVVMNIQAVIVERESGRSMMSGFHGFYSVGGIFGAGIATVLLSQKIPPLTTTVTLTVASIVILALATPGILPYGSQEASPPFALPKGKIVLIGALCFIVFMAEGSVLDWSGVFLKETFAIPKENAGFGYVAFALTMTLGRLTGDRLVPYFGPKKILVLGGLTASLGFFLAALAPTPLLSVLGFAFVGAGASNVVPVLFTIAGNQTQMPANLAISAVTTMGYTGILAGPAILGFLAESVNLPVALTFVAVLLFMVVTSAQAATKPDSP